MALWSHNEKSARHTPEGFWTILPPSFTCTYAIYLGPTWGFYSQYISTYLVGIFLQSCTNTCWQEWLQYGLWEALIWYIFFREVPKGLPSILITFQLTDVIIPDVQMPHTPTQTHTYYQRTFQYKRVNCSWFWILDSSGTSFQGILFIRNKKSFKNWIENYSFTFTKHTLCQLTPNTTNSIVSNDNFCSRTWADKAWNVN